MKSEQVDLDQFRKGSLTKVAKKASEVNTQFDFSGHIFGYMVGIASLAEGIWVHLGPQQHLLIFCLNICELYLLYVGAFF